MLSEAFWTPSQLDEYSELNSRTKVRPIKNQLYSPNTPNYVREQMFAQLRTGFTTAETVGTVRVGVPSTSIETVGTVRVGVPSKSIETVGTVRVGGPSTSIETVGTVRVGGPSTSIETVGTVRVVGPRRRVT